MHCQNHHKTLPNGVRPKVNQRSHIYKRQDKFCAACAPKPRDWRKVVVMHKRVVVEHIQLIHSSPRHSISSTKRRSEFHAHYSRFYTPPNQSVAYGMNHTTASQCQKPNTHRKELFANRLIKPKQTHNPQTNAYTHRPSFFHYYFRFGLAIIYNRSRARAFGSASSFFATTSTLAVRRLHQRLVLV